MMQRGELYRVDLGEPRGSAPAKRRPAVIVQADAYNATRISTVVVAAITSNTRLAAMPGNVFVPATVAGLPQDSVVNVTQLATVDRRYLEARIGVLPARLLGDVDRGLRSLLALR
jgi:mRNA interferase MazF